MPKHIRDQPLGSQHPNAQQRAETRWNMVSDQPNPLPRKKLLFVLKNLSARVRVSCSQHCGADFGNKKTPAPSPYNNLTRDCTRVRAKVLGGDTVFISAFDAVFCCATDLCFASRHNATSSCGLLPPIGLAKARKAGRSGLSLSYFRLRLVSEQSLHGDNLSGK